MIRGLTNLWMWDSLMSSFPWEVQLILEIIIHEDASSMYCCVFSKWGLQPFQSSRTHDEWVPAKPGPGLSHHWAHSGPTWLWAQKGKFQYPYSYNWSESAAIWSQKCTSKLSDTSPRYCSLLKDTLRNILARAVMAGSSHYKNIHSYCMQVE